MGIDVTSSVRNSETDRQYHNNVVVQQPKSLGSMCGIKVGIINNPTREEVSLTTLHLLEGVGIGAAVVGTLTNLPIVSVAGATLSCTSFMLDQMIQDDSSEKTQGNICFVGAKTLGIAASSAVCLGAQALLAPAEALSSPCTFTVKLAMTPLCLMGATLLPNVAVMSSSRVGDDYASI